LVSETGLLLPGIVKEEIRHELYPPLEPMFKNFVLKELLPTNGIYATMIDNFKRITVIAYTTFNFGKGATYTTSLCGYTPSIGRHLRWGG
jgi:hypothetical protein